MARTRDIKPGFFKNPELVETPFECRLLFIGLWLLADRDGKGEDAPKKIRMEIFPADNVDCDAAMQALAAKHDRQGVPLVVRYEVEGQHYYWLPGFSKHQKPHPREVASAIPDPPEHILKALQGDLFQTKVVASPAGSSLSSLPSRPSPPESATRLPKDWEPNEDFIGAAVAMFEGGGAWTREHALRIAAAFRDYWIAKSGKDATKTDWLATWRNWVRREGPMREQRGSARDSLVERNKAAAAEFVRRQQASES